MFQEKRDRKKLQSLEKEVKKLKTENKELKDELNELYDDRDCIKRERRNNVDMSKFEGLPIEEVINRLNAMGYNVRQSSTDLDEFRRVANSIYNDYTVTSTVGSEDSTTITWGS